MFQPANTKTRTAVVSPLSIERLRLRKYEAQLAFIKEMMVAQHDFRAFLASYRSDGLKVFARLNLPCGEIPARGFPVVVFAHGASPNPLDPNYFQRPYYEAWINAYTRAGFATIMPGYRGHGVIDGQEAQGKEYVEWFANLHLATPFYAIDVLNLLAGLADIPAFEWHKVGIESPTSPMLDTDSLFLAAHSMGAEVALKVLTVTSSFKASSLWAGVTADIRDVVRFYTRYDVPETATEQQIEAAIQANWEQVNSVSSAMPFINIKTTNGFFYLENLASPVILHQGTGDYAVDPTWAIALHEKLQKLGKDSTLYLYEGNDHEFSLNNGHHIALERDVAFFKNYLQKEK